MRQFRGDASTTDRTMSQTKPAIFECSGCGKRFRWKPELAGRAVKCPCGNVMTAPAQAPSDDDNLYDVVVEPSAAVSTTPKARATQIAATQVNPSQPVLGYQAKRDASATLAAPAADGYFPNPLKDFQIPLVLLCAGLVVESAAAVWTAVQRSHSVWIAVVALFIGLVISTALMLAGVFITAKTRGFSLGRFWPAVLKLSAISVAPSAAMTLLYIFLRFIPFGIIATWIAGFVFYFALIGVSFDLEESDTWYCVIVIFLVKLTVALVILAALSGKFW
jgi:hypothetical protein